MRLCALLAPLRFSSRNTIINRRVRRAAQSTYLSTLLKFEGLGVLLEALGIAACQDGAAERIDEYHEGGLARRGDKRIACDCTSSSTQPGICGRYRHGGSLSAQWFAIFMMNVFDLNIYLLLLTYKYYFGFK
jgi:hypothetical protein